MGYPDDFKIVVSDTQAYRQFGNSVVVPVVERIAQRVVESLERPVEYTPELILVMNDKANAEPAKRIGESGIRCKAKGKTRA